MEKINILELFKNFKSNELFYIFKYHIIKYISYPELIEKYELDEDMRIKIVNERATSHHGGLKASRAGITMGENNGNIDDHLARLESGDSTLCIIM